MTIIINRIVLDHCTTTTFFNSTPVTFTVKIVDKNGNALPAGMTITFAATNGKILTDNSFTVPSNATFLPPPPYAVTMRSDAWQYDLSTTPYGCSDLSSGSSGTFTLKVTTPTGIVTSASVIGTD